MGNAFGCCVHDKYDLTITETTDSENVNLSKPNGPIKSIHNYMEDKKETELVYPWEGKEIIEEFGEMRTEIEGDVEFSQECIIKYIEQLFLKEGDDIGKWEQKLNKEDVKCRIKKGGSDIDKKSPYLWTELYLNEYFSVHKIIKSIFRPELRKKWDKNVKDFEMTPTNHANAYLSYQKNNAPLKYDDRDFVTKYVMITPDANTFYSYSTSIPNSERAVQDKVVRAETLISCQKMTKLEDGRTLYQMIQQNDVKIEKIPPAIISTFLPSGMQDWHKKMSKFMMDNYDQI